MFEAAPPSCSTTATITGRVFYNTTATHQAASTICLNEET
jgi:hypothetical protein